MIDWPAELDALIAASEHHTLLLENDDVRVLETWIAPGDTTPLHTHRWPSALYVLSGDDFVRRDAEGNVLVDTRGTEMNGPAFWSAPLPPHTLENVGPSEIHTISVELKRG